MKHFDINKKAMLFVIFLLLIDELAHDTGPESAGSQVVTHSIHADEISH